ncbi:MAG: 4-hydroxy-tetrahydrodipicolinate reductase [Firmicutes bacterium]|nr:4-hydroxy-tetrahydrodipicolinate reductase [Bacillota bacterium]
MGQEVLKQVQDSEDLSVICGVDKVCSGDYDFPVYDDIHDVKEQPDVIIDFSVPEASIEALKFASAGHIPTVIATTGFSDEQLNLIKEYSEKVPIFRSASMSYEVNIMSDIIAKLAALLTDADIEIIETHHHNKVDSPSGTALLLADSINNALDNTMYYEYNRHVKKEKRNPKEIGIHSIRGGTVVGSHTVSFFGDNESFEITHTVNSRSVFAKGALKAARFIVNQKNGMYSMKDLF